MYARLDAHRWTWPKHNSRDAGAKRFTATTLHSTHTHTAPLQRIEIQAHVYRVEHRHTKKLATNFIAPRGILKVGQQNKLKTPWIWIYIYIAHRADELRVPFLGGLYAKLSVYLRQCRRGNGPDRAECTKGPVYYVAEAERDLWADFVESRGTRRHCRCAHTAGRVDVVVPHFNGHLCWRCCAEKSRTHTHPKSVVLRARPSVVARGPFGVTPPRPLC